MNERPRGWLTLEARPRSTKRVSIWPAMFCFSVAAYLAYAWWLA